MRSLLRLIVLSIILHTPHLYLADPNHDYEPPPQVPPVPAQFAQPIVKEVDGLVATLDRQTNILLLDHRECYCVQLVMGNQPLCMDVTKKPYLIVIGHADGSVLMIESTPPHFFEDNESTIFPTVRALSLQFMDSPIHEINIADDHNMLTMSTSPSTLKIISLELHLMLTQAHWHQVAITIPDKENKV